MKIKHLHVILVLLIILVLPKHCFGLPIYMNWRSSNSIKYYSLFSEYSIHTKDDYNIHFGIDTLYKEIHANLDLTNQEECLVSQVIIDKAILDYQKECYGLKLSIEDFGYGKAFLLYNRRNDDALFGKNRLFSYRWHGISAHYNYKSSKIGFGFGNNYVNYTVSHANYNFKNDLLDLHTYAIYTPNDNQFNIPVYHIGTEFMLSKGRLNLHTAYAYSIYPKHKFFPEMNNYHLINELKIKVTPIFNAILSSDYKTIPENDKDDFLHELALEFKYKKLHSYVCINQRNVINEKAYTYFSDVNFDIAKSLTVGAIYDYVDFKHSKSYSKIGIQSTYLWK